MRSAALLLIPLCASAEPPLTTDEVVARMVASDKVRAASMPAYTGLRRYTLENLRFKTHAEMSARVTCDITGAKSFEVLSEAGPKPVRSLVLHKMLDAETDASRPGQREKTLFRPENYKFRLAGSEELNGRPAYILEIEPKISNRFLTRGRIWVDAADFAVVKLEGSPAQSPSMWVSKVTYVHLYEKIEGHWLPRSNHSRSESRFFGATLTGIEYSTYQLQQPAKTQNP